LYLSDQPLRPITIRGIMRKPPWMRLRFDHDALERL
jgi:hypothetical protein